MISFFVDIDCAISLGWAAYLPPNICSRLRIFFALDYNVVIVLWLKVLDTIWVGVIRWSLELTHILNGVNFLAWRTISHILSKKFPRILLQVLLYLKNWAFSDRFTKRPCLRECPNRLIMAVSNVITDLLLLVLLITLRLETHIHWSHLRIFGVWLWWFCNFAPLMVAKVNTFTFFSLLLFLMSFHRAHFIEF